ncbi:MAG: succinate dehydrogenase, hydrophobic membrane anchor protein [Zetaproteobacteria bacterium]|nr:MAG: succinate dehydrogenase, hydrophobic membrane anchor protein [Zetaproteobacteria bacterium]
MTAPQRRYRLGTAHNGLSDWYLQRISAVLLALLLPAAFLLLLCVRGGGYDHASLWSLLHHPWLRVLHSLLAGALILHLYTGLKVIVEDYLHAPCLRVIASGALATAGFALLGWWLAAVWRWTM